MKYLKYIAFFLFVLSACKKESQLPTLTFSAEEKNWFIYQVGQSFTFKNSAGDSMTYYVTRVDQGFRKEYKDPFTNPVEIGTAAFYQVDLKGTTDSIFIYFYKANHSNPGRMYQTIGWNQFVGQFVELEAIKTKSPFSASVINGVSYNKVTQANPESLVLYSWTRWKSALYDQDFGFIEITDMNGIAWLRQ